MKRALLLILVALLTVAVLLFIFNPQVLEDVWLWIVGLIGPIIATIKSGFQGIARLFKSDKDEGEVSETDESSPAASQEVLRQSKEREAGLNKQIAELETKIDELETNLKDQELFDSFEGTTLSVIRFVDDGETTLGLLFFNDKFYCYTLEDTKREKKIPGETRIPSGTYTLGFNEYDTDLTKKYRKTRAWFKYHLHVKNVPDFVGIYIHSGNNHSHTEGCLLVADTINTTSAQKAILSSRQAFERLYKELRPIIESGANVRIKYFDEDWFANSSISKRIIQV